MRILFSVEYLPTRDIFNVRWNDVNEENVIPHRKSYTRAMKADFVAEVENAAAYLQEAGW